MVTPALPPDTATSEAPSASGDVAPAKGRALSVKAKLFCLEYPKDFNGTQSVIRAGFSKTGADVTAVRLLGDPRIQAEIAKVIDARRRQLRIDANWVLRQARHLLALATRPGETVRGPDGKDRVGGIPHWDRNGELVGYKPDLAAGKAALELIGKHIDVGAFLEKVDVTSKGNEIKAERPKQIMIFAGTEIEFE